MNITRRKSSLLCGGSLTRQADNCMRCMSFALPSEFFIWYFDGKQTKHRWKMVSQSVFIEFDQHRSRKRWKDERSMMDGCIVRMKREGEMFKCQQSTNGILYMLVNYERMERLNYSRIVICLNSHDWSHCNFPIHLITSFMGYDDLLLAKSLLALLGSDEKWNSLKNYNNCRRK